MPNVIVKNASGEDVLYQDVEGVGLEGEDGNIELFLKQKQSDWKQTDENAVDFIKNKPEIPEFTEQVQANWNQTDENAVDYIKHKPDQTNWDVTDPKADEFIVNKPFGKSPDFFIQQQTCTFKKLHDYTEAFSGDLIIPKGSVIAIGESYKVTFDGTEYICVAGDCSLVKKPSNSDNVSFDQSGFIGNSSLIYEFVGYSDGGVDTGEPFVIFGEPKLNFCLTMSTETSHTIKVDFQNAEKKIDEKWLPSSIATKTDVNNAKNEAKQYTDKAIANINVSGGGSTGGNGGGFSESDLTNETVVFEEQNLTFAVSEGNSITYPASGNEAPNNGLLGLIVGQEYTVFVDGTENKCVAKKYSMEGFDMIYLGNMYLETGLETDNTGESFLIYEVSVMNSWIIGMEVPDATVLDHTLKITTVGYNELFYWENIKNPPFEETKKEEQATFLDTSIELTWYPNSVAGTSYGAGGRWDNDEVTGNNDLGFTVEPTNNFTLKVGDTYKVTFDGTVYENVVCNAIEGIIPFLGNTTISGTEDTTTPYIIIQDTVGLGGTPNTWYVTPMIDSGAVPDDITVSSTKTFSFKVEGVAKTVDIKQIEAKYVYGSTFPVYFTPPEDGTFLGTPVENPTLSVPFDTICELIDRGHTPEFYLKQGPMVMSQGRFVAKYGEELLGFVNSGGSVFENTFTQITKEDGVVSLVSDELGAQTLDVTISNSSGTYTSNYYPRVIKNTYDIGIPIRATCDGIIMNLQAISSTSATFYVRAYVENDIIDSWVTINSDKSVTMKTVTTPIPTASA